MKRIILPFLLIAAVLIFGLLPTWADDFGGSHDSLVTSVIPWTSVTFESSGLDDIVVGNPYVAFRYGSLINSHVVTVSETLNNPSLVDPVTLTYNLSNSQSLINRVKASFAYQLPQGGNNHVTVTFDCDHVVMTGGEFRDFINSVYVEPINQTRNVNLDVTLEFSYIYTDIDRRAVGETADTLSDSRIYETHSEKRFMAFKNTPDSLDEVQGAYIGQSLNDVIQSPSSTAYPTALSYMVKDVYTEWVDGELYRSVTTDRGFDTLIDFSEIVLTIDIYDIGDQVQFAITQTIQPYDTQSAAFGTVSFANWGIDTTFSFDSITRAVGSFFDVSIGGVSLGMLGMFGIGVLLAITFLKVFKGG